MQTRKRLARDVFDAFVKQSSLVNDVIDTHPVGDKMAALTVVISSISKEQD